MEGEMMDKMIYIAHENKMIPITDLNRKDYENFLDAMLRLASKYITAVREKEEQNDG